MTTNKPDETRLEAQVRVQARSIEGMQDEIRRLRIAFVREERRAERFDIMVAGMAKAFRERGFDESAENLEEARDLVNAQR